MSTIHIGRSGFDADLYVGRENSGHWGDSIAFDLHPTGSDGSRCHNITVKQAQEIVDALTSAIEQVPDITLPDLYDGTHNDASPTGTEVGLDGMRLRLVNWHDYRGWEVRPVGRSDNDGLRPLTYGYLTVLAAETTTYNVRPIGGLEQRGYKRIDDALRALVTLAS